jgi:PAS domain S-box-containing protein
MEKISAKNGRDLDHLLYENVFEKSPALIGFVGFDGNIKKINSCFYETLGYNSDEILGRSFQDLIHPDDRDISKLELERIKSGKLQIFFETRYHCRMEALSG